MKYICPICGKTYDKTTDLAACVQKCAVMAEKKEERATELADKIQKTYATLKSLVNEYNELSVGKIFQTSLTNMNDLALRPNETIHFNDMNFKDKAFKGNKNLNSVNQKEEQELEKQFTDIWSAILGDFNEDSWNIGGNKAKQVKFSNKTDTDTDSEFEKFLKDTLKIEKPNFKDTTTSSKKMTDSANDVEDFMGIFNRLMEVFGEPDENK